MTIEAREQGLDLGFHDTIPKDIIPKMAVLVLFLGMLNKAS